MHEPALASAPRCPTGHRGAVGERGSSLRRLCAGRHVGGQGTAPQRGALSTAGRNTASGYSDVTAAAAGAVLRVILCPAEALRSLACGSAGCGWCATGRELLL